MTVKCWQLTSLQSCYFIRRQVWAEYICPLDTWVKSEEPGRNVIRTTTPQKSFFRGKKYAHYFFTLKLIMSQKQSTLRKRSPNHFRSDYQLHLKPKFSLLNSYLWSHTNEDRWNYFSSASVSSVEVTWHFHGYTKLYRSLTSLAANGFL